MEADFAKRSYSPWGWVATGAIEITRIEADMKRRNVESTASENRTRVGTNVMNPGRVIVNG